MGQPVPRARSRAEGRTRDDAAETVAVARPAARLAYAHAPATTIVAALTAATAAIVLFRLGRKPIWEDEAYTWSLVARDWSKYVAAVRHEEGQNVLYSLLMFGWVRLGDSEAFLRFPSAVFAVSTVPAMYVAGRALADRRVGLIAALLIAVNVNIVEFGQEARAYTLQLLLITLSLAAFASWVRNPRRAAWWTWVVLSSLLAYVHPYTIFVVVAQLLSLVFLRPARDVLRGATVGAIIVTVCSAPMLALISGQREGTERPGLPSAGLTLRSVTGLFGKAGPVLVCAWGALLVYAAVVTVRQWPAPGLQRWRRTMPWCAYGVVVALVLGVVVFRNAIAPRHILVALPGLVLLGAMTLHSIPSRRWFAATTAGLVVLSLLGVAKWQFQRPKQGWRAATADVVAASRPGDAVVFLDDQARIAFEYYLRDEAVARRRLVPAYPAKPWGEWGTGDERIELPTRALGAAIAREHDRIWTVVRPAIYDAPYFRDHEFVRRDEHPGLLFPAHFLAERKTYNGVALYRYDRS